MMFPQVREMLLARLLDVPCTLVIMGEVDEDFVSRLRLGLVGRRCPLFLSRHNAAHLAESQDNALRDPRALHA